MIDKTSLKIVGELCHDGRTNNIELAQKLGVSVLTVAKKINYMIEEGIITIKAMPNPIKMGYQAKAFIGLYVDINKIETICSHLIKDNRVNTVTICFGRFNILLIVFSRDWENLEYFVKQELPLIDGIRRIGTYLIMDDTKWNSSTFSNDSAESKPISIDKIDQKLIKELIINGRPNYTDLSKKLGISKPTISRRISSLIKENTIKIVAVPNLAKLGYLANAFILLRVDLVKLNTICKQLSGHSEVFLVSRVLNDFEILVGVYTANVDELYDSLRNKIESIDGILEAEVFIHVNLYHFSVNYALPSFFRT
jgi:DNA-binding Lrp family transcriptional regulator